jgi:hypothetical protein
MAGIRLLLTFKELMVGARLIVVLGRRALLRILMANTI